MLKRVFAIEYQIFFLLYLPYNMLYCIFLEEAYCWQSRLNRARRRVVYEALKRPTSSEKLYKQ